MSETPIYLALGGLIHIVGLAENTLCGMSVDGEDGAAPSLRVVPQRIGCEQCIALIEYAKQIPNKHHRNRKRSTRANRFDSVGSQPVKEVK